MGLRRQDGCRSPSAAIRRFARARHAPCLDGDPLRCGHGGMAKQKRAGWGPSEDVGAGGCPLQRRQTAGMTVSASRDLALRMVFGSMAQTISFTSPVLARMFNSDIAEHGSSAKS